MTNEEMMAEAKRFVMQCQACGSTALPHLHGGDPMVGIRQYIAEHGFGRCNVPPIARGVTLTLVLR